jgi:hypothetical protein
VWSRNGHERAFHGFLKHGSTFTQIDVAQLTLLGYAIDNRTDLAGWHLNQQGNLHRFVLSGGNLTTIDVPGSLGTVVTGHLWQQRHQYSTRAGAGQLGRRIVQELPLAGKTPAEIPSRVLQCHIYTAFRKPDSQCPIADSRPDSLSRNPRQIQFAMKLVY